MDKHDAEGTLNFRFFAGGFQPATRVRTTFSGVKGREAKVLTG